VEIAAAALRSRQFPARRRLFKIKNMLFRFLLFLNNEKTYVKAKR
jgi:hypothetical protein